MALPSFTEALAYAQARKVVLPAEFYDPANVNHHGELMTVSHLAGLSQIQSVTDELMKALEKGQTFEDWQQQALGVDGVGALPPGRTETIFRNYMQTAYNGGRWAKFEANKATTPYLMYSAINDERTTMICRHRNGIIRAVDDDFWTLNSPPAHHRCRSTLIALTKSQAQTRSPGETGLNQPPPTDPVQTGWGYKPTPSAVGTGDALAHILADKLKDFPKSWWSRITDLFIGAWSLLGGLLKNILP